MRFQLFEVTRTVDPLSPPGSVGYDIGNCVALLFDKIAAERLDPGKADLSTLTVRRTAAGVQASIYVEDDALPFPVDRLSPTL